MEDIHITEDSCTSLRFFKNMYLFTLLTGCGQEGKSIMLSSTPNAIHPHQTNLMEENWTKVEKKQPQDKYCHNGAQMDYLLGLIPTRHQPAPTSEIIALNWHLKSTERLNGKTLKAEFKICPGMSSVQMN